MYNTCIYACIRDRQFYVTSNINASLSLYRRGERLFHIILIIALRQVKYI